VLHFELGTIEEITLIFCSIVLKKEIVS
jgi:hypothetical protein